MSALNFSLPDQNGSVHALSDYKGTWLVVYFYPKDDTPGCTTQACTFRDLGKEFSQKGVHIVGISKDSVRSHKKFADKYHLMFPLLSDPEGKVVEAYGAWGEKSMFGRKFMGILRNTYLINPQGDIVKKYVKVNPLTHPKEILDDISKAIG